MAADSRKIDVLKTYLENGFDINSFEGGGLDWTALHYAAGNEDFRTVQFLLENGADVNAYCEENIGETPLGHVVPECSYKMAKILVLAGADPTIQGWMWLTALDRAARRRDDDGPRILHLLQAAAKGEINKGRMKF